MRLRQKQTVPIYPLRPMRVFSRCHLFCSAVRGLQPGPRLLCLWDGFWIPYLQLLAVQTNLSSRRALRPGCYSDVQRDFVFANEHHMLTLLHVLYVYAHDSVCARPNVARTDACTHTLVH
eukprot:1585504-Pleurochrysis_carterae.AAC.1